MGRNEKERFAKYDAGLPFYKWVWPPFLRKRLRMAYHVMHVQKMLMRSLQGELRELRATNRELIAALEELQK